MIFIRARLYELLTTSPISLISVLYWHSTSVLLTAITTFLFPDILHPRSYVAPMSSMINSTDILYAFRVGV